MANIDSQSLPEHVDLDYHAGLWAVLCLKCSRYRVFRDKATALSEVDKHRDCLAKGAA